MASPCLGFGAFAMRVGPLSPRPRGNLQSRRAQIKPEQPNPPAQGPSSPQLTQAASEAVRHLPVLDSAQVQRAQAPFLPASGAISSLEGSKSSLNDLTPPTQGQSSPLLAPAALTRYSISLSWIQRRFRLCGPPFFPPKGQS